MLRNLLDRFALVGVLLLAVTPLSARAAQAGGGLSERVKAAASVLLEIGASGDKRIPEELMQRAAGVAVFPGVVKAAAGIGNRYGKGLISERLADGHWSAPVFVTIGGGSWSPQVGVTTTDLVLVITNADALRTLEEGTELKLGVDASVVAGPLGRTAKIGTDAKLQAAIYTYSRAKGRFDGIVLDGAVLDIDDGADNQVYGQGVTAKAIIFGETIMANATVKPFIDALEQTTLIKKVTQR
jgi:lipid-binding SYLF domain-containing protein